MAIQPPPIIDPTQEPASPDQWQAMNLPPLNPGDRLSREEFERRYHAHPEIKKAELIDGVVYMPSPTRHQMHGQPHARLSVWLGTYWTATPGTDMSDNATLRLDNENEAQPDLLLRLEKGAGGRSTITEDDYLEGPPELIVEIAASSAAYDLHNKRYTYGRSGVPEYLVIQMYEQKIDWFVLRAGIYETLPVDENGILRSELFPGLWLDTAAFWSNDLPALLATLQAGLNSSEHTAFTTHLKARKET